MGIRYFFISSNDLFFFFDRACWRKVKKWNSPISSTVTFFHHFSTMSKRKISDHTTPPTADQLTEARTHVTKARKQADYKRRKDPIQIRNKTLAIRFRPFPNIQKKIASLSDDFVEGLKL